MGSNMGRPTQAPGRPNATAATEAPRFNLTLVFPSPDPAVKPPTTRKVKRVTRESLKGIMERFGIGGLVPLPAGVAPDEVALDEVAFEAPEDVELVNGSTYLVVQQVSPNKERVEQRWQLDSSCVEADQHVDQQAVVGAKHALTKLLEAAGYPEAKVLCAKRLWANGIMVEVDGIAAMADGCAFIVENKPTLTAESAAVLAAKVSTIRAMVDAVDPSSGTYLGQLKGKQLLSVLCGRPVTSNTTDLSQMADICRQHKIECWDVSGSSGVEPMSSGGGRFKSPYVHPFGEDRGSTTAAAAAAHKAATRAGAASAAASSALRGGRSHHRHTLLLGFAPRAACVMSSQLAPRLRLL